MCTDCSRLHEQLLEHETTMFHLKKTITQLRRDLRYERRRNGKLSKELLEKKNPKPKYKNGRNGRRG